MDKVIKNKRGLELVTSHFSQNKFRKNSLIVIYYLTKFDDVIYSSFWVTPKITSANLFHLHLSFWIWKVWKGREKLQKCGFLENEKSFLDEIKFFFAVFEGLSFDEKIKNW